MWFENIIQNFAYYFGVNLETAGVLVSFVFISSIILSVYILTRGTVSNSKTWIVVSTIISIFLFTYPIEWMSIWVLIATFVFIAIYVAAKVSKVGGGGSS